VVPARLGSTRFFGKLLEPIFGKPVVVHTLERAAAAGCFDRVICLTDSAEIGAAAAAQGFDFVLTGEAANGTERIARALDLPGLRDSDLIVNLQGDEPAFPEEGLRTLCAAIVRNPEWVHLLVHADEPSREDLENPNRVKAVVDADGFVTGFVRVVAPIRRDDACVIPADGMKYRLQLGAYAYSRDYLRQYAALPPSAAEIEMSHEILRAPGLAPLRARTAPTRHHGASVDVPDDLIAARNALEALEAQREAVPSVPIPTISDSQPRLQGVPA
jgi:3-deoxy-manno-octulosonate cytidylyltransferase (CMP-KDO synthetase)